VCPGQPNIPSLPEPTLADTLGVRALNAGPRCIVLRECFGRLALACGVQRLILFLRLEPHDTGLLLGPRTLGALRTGRAILAGKARLPGHAILGIGIGEPGDTLLAHGAGDDLPLPVNEKLRFVEPRARSRLPTGIVSHGAEERDAVGALTVHQDLGVRIALLDQVFRRQQPPRLQGRMESGQHLIIGRRGGGGLDIDTERRRVREAGLLPPPALRTGRESFPSSSSSISKAV
jgi:hypothetical protein